MRKTFQAFIFLTILILVSGCNAPAVVPTAEILTTPSAVPATSVPTTIPPSELPSMIPTESEVIVPTVESAPAYQIQSLLMLDAQNGYSIGRDPQGIRSLSQTTDGGATWSEMQLPEELLSIDRTNINLLIAAARNGPLILVAESGEFTSNTPRVYISPNRDGTWQPSNDLDVSMLESFFVTQVDMIDENTGWLLAHVGAGMNHDYLAIYRTDDGGTTWNRLLDPYADSTGVQVCYKNQLFFADKNNGWLTGTCNGVASGVYLYRTPDGGTTWETVTLPAPVDQPELFTNFSQVCESAFPQTDEKGAVHIAVNCKNMEDPLKQLSSYVYRTTDNGSHWQIQPYPGGSLVIVSQTKWFSAESTWHSSADGGGSWNDLPVAYGYLDSFQKIGEKIWVITSDVNGLKNLYSSIDGGRNWQKLQ